MTHSSSASAGPHASSVAQPTREECFSSVAAPPPSVQRWSEYPAAEPMRTDVPAQFAYPSRNNSAVKLELAVQYDHPTVTGDSATTAQDKGLCTVCRSTTQSDLVFYRPQMQVRQLLRKGGDQQEGGAVRHGETPVDATMDGDAPNPPTRGVSAIGIPKAFLPYVTLYGPQKQALWSLTGTRWGALEFTSSQQQIVVKMATDKLVFVWTNNASYQWRFMPAQDGKTYELRCYEGRKVIAEFVSNHYIQWSHNPAAPSNTSNPFRQQPSSSSSPPPPPSPPPSAAEDDASFSSFLLLSGLLILDLAGCPPHSAPDPERLKLLLGEMGIHDMPGGGDNDDMMDDDAASTTSSIYYAEQGLVDDDHAPTGRWYNGGGSVKSIELDPGLLHCWWGYGFWWTWCPCCMPGGWLDRFRWSLRRRKDNIGTGHSTLSRSRQRRQRGWQQHHQPDQY